MKKFIIPLVIVLSLGSATGWYSSRQEISPTAPTPFCKIAIKRGRLIATIRTTGTLEAEEVVEVSARVPGRIESIGPDPSGLTRALRWGSVVKKGAVLAQLETDALQAQVQTALTELGKNTFDLVQKEARLTKAEADWTRVQRLFPRGISLAEFDEAKASEKVAKAAVEIGKLQVQTAEAALALARANLASATITAPVQGVVIDQCARVGQTVTAGSAPSLFRIATDLGRMEIWANVNEADAGKIQIGQSVHFTVDAMPGAVYQGSVKVLGKLASRLNAAGNEPAGTHTVVVSVDNTGGKLTPYLTAKLTFVIRDQSDALSVPNAALLWQPSQRQLHPGARDTHAGLKLTKGPCDEPAARGLGVVWVEDQGGLVRPIQVRLGLSDGIHTEILEVIDGDLPAGTAVITS